MMKTICKLCRGAKKTRGLGCMVRECLECAGKGYVIANTKPVELHKECVTHEKTNLVPEVKTIEKIRRKYQTKGTPNNGLLDGTIRA